MLPAHISLATSAHFRPRLALFAAGKGEKPRVLPATWAFSHLPQPEPISFSISRVHHKSAPTKGPKRPTFSPCRIFIQSRLLGLLFTGIQRRSGVAALEWGCTPRSNQTCQGPVAEGARTAGILSRHGGTPSGLPRLGGTVLPVRTLPLKCSRTQFFWEISACPRVECHRSPGPETLSQPALSALFSIKTRSSCDMLLEESVGLPRENEGALVPWFPVEEWREEACSHFRVSGFSSTVGSDWRDHLRDYVQSRR